MPRVREVCHVPEASERLAALAPELNDLLREELEALTGCELCGGEHVKLLLVDGRAVRLNLFVDVDGTLWVERVGVA